MLLIAVSCRRCGWNLRAKLDTAINYLLSANHARLKTLYCGIMLPPLHPSTRVMVMLNWRPFCETRSQVRGNSPSPAVPRDTCFRSRIYTPNFAVDRCYSSYVTSRTSKRRSTVCRVRTGARLRQRAFYVSGPNVWNSLPAFRGTVSHALLVLSAALSHAFRRLFRHFSALLLLRCDWH